MDMKYKDIPFYAYGFSDSDLGMFGAEHNELQIIKVTDNTIRSWLGNGDLSICVMHLSSAEEVNLFRQLRVEFPLFSWGVCIDPNDRNILSKLLHRENFILLLYPLTKDSISIAVQKLFQGIFEVRIQNSLFDGLRVLHQSYRWTTREIEVQAVAHHLSEQLYMAGFSPGSQKKDMTTLAIEEALLNAVEHGNLELDSALKEEDVLGLAYEEEKQKRMQNPEFGERFVNVELSVDRDTAKLEIINDGPPFDYETVLDDLHLKVERNKEKASGKGLWLIKNAFHQIIYSRGGKSLTLVKHKNLEELDDGQRQTGRQQSSNSNRR